MGRAYHHCLLSIIRVLSSSPHVGLERALPIQRYAYVTSHQYKKFEEKRRKKRYEPTNGSLPNFKSHSEYTYLGLYQGIEAAN